MHGACGQIQPLPMKLRFHLLLLLLISVLPWTGAMVRAEDLAARVIVLANSDDPDSVRLARTYAERRGVPFDNIIALKMPLGEVITWPEFVLSIQQPLQDELLRRGWIDGIVMDLRDEAGRRKVAMSGHRISYLVVCRGVPLRIAHDPALYRPVPPLTNRAEFRTNGGAVDAELSLLAQSGFPINAFVPNPLFRNDRPGGLEQGRVVKVSRLDGPTFEQARGLIESALAAERSGLIGRAYVDTGGLHPDGDQWLEATARELSGLGYDLDVHRPDGTMAAEDRADGAVLYFGWYASDLNGPFAVPGYQFAPGTVALHIHSFSAQTLRREHGGGWAGPLVARGVAATFGNVGEPYLQLTHQPQLILRALARGDTLGDAAYYALPALSWQGIVIGDPLYRPFKVSLEDQWEQRGRVPPVLQPYLVLRQLNTLDAAGLPGEALLLARESIRASPGAVLALELARREEAAGDPAAAVEALARVATLPAPGSSEWALHAQIARQLDAYGAPIPAFAVWKALLGSGDLPPVLMSAWLEEAHRVAVRAGEDRQAADWARQRERLQAQP